ncbi:pp78/83 [Alphabaculovirus altersperidaniae]|uniref:Pp78/83 n=1 Tax=Spodoptera eridania nucleopolyhedrovirus TaxID=2315721 RepID=A0ABX6TR25_9ABAC|nr:pp78/83 [Spodoptera eridania nucleopolyhedrovirus]QNV47850.1 pp78/83 [Spodoptera eridania nucleopolyhedrovirus]
MTTQSVLDFFQDPQNDIVDLFRKLTVPVSMELFDAVCYRDDNRSVYDDEITLNSRTLLEFLQLSLAIYDNKVKVRVDANLEPTKTTTTIPAAMTAKITLLENMVRQVNDSSRFKSKLQNILEHIINENNVNNLSALFKTFLDLYKLYRVEESEIDTLFQEIVTLDHRRSETAVSSASPSVAAVAKPKPSLQSAMGAEQSYVPPPPPLTSTTSFSSTIIDKEKTAEEDSNFVSLPPPLPPPMPNLISTPNAPLSTTTDVPSIDTFIPPPPPPPPLSLPSDQVISSLPPPPPPPPPPSASLPMADKPVAVVATPTPAAPAPTIDFNTELKERLKRKTPLSPDKFSTLQPKRVQKPIAQNVPPRSESTLSILQRRVAVEPSSTSSGTEVQDEDNDWLASSTEITALKTQFRDLQKKIERLPMEPSESITTLMTAISSVFDKPQIFADDAETLRAYMVKLERLIKDAMTL